jgi:hypothetical protein
MPWGRLSTWLLIQLTPRPTDLPLAAALQGPLALIAAMWLAYWFMSREMGRCLYGLVAMILFGITLKYNEVIFWFAASFAVLALDTILLALLAAQQWRLSGRRRWLVLCAIGCALAPGWFASGILAGPFCSLYLLAWQWRAPDGSKARGLLGRLGPLLVPILGTAVFLAVSLPLTAEQIDHAQHFAGQRAHEVFAPWQGLQLTGRTLVDNLILGLHALGRTCPPAAAPLVLAALALPAWWWWRKAPRLCHPLMILGLGMMGGTYWLIYSFRSAWPYEAMMVGWTRYNLMPFLGLVFFACAGLPSRQGTLFTLHPSGLLSRGQVFGLALLAGLLLVLQFPQGLVGHRLRDRDPEPQQAALRQIEDMDARCQAHNIDGDTARRILDHLTIPYSGDPEPRINGWELLRGSMARRTLSMDEARKILLR